MAPQLFLVALMTRVQRGRRHLEVRELRDGGLDHRLEGADLDVAGFSSTPSTLNPSEAVKSSSFPIITSTCLAISRLTSWAFFNPPIVFQSEGR